MIYIKVRPSLSVCPLSLSASLQLPFSVLILEHFSSYNMSTAASIESGILAPELREALRAFLSRKSTTYHEFHSTADGPGVCISTSYADLRRAIEAEYQTKLDSGPKVPAHYCVGGRRKLPDSRPSLEVKSTRQYVDAGTQTEARLGLTASQVESAPESRTHRPKKLRRTPVSRVICSSSTDTDSTARPARQIGSQGLLSLSRYLLLC